jgi:hypothetical protein
MHDQAPEALWEDIKRHAVYNSTKASGCLCCDRAAVSDQ